MDPSAAEIEFLATSEHRVGVLGALAGRRQDRADLRAATGASAPTVGRVLGDFEDRRWIERDGREYALTPLGEFVSERFAELLDAMGTERKLRDVWQWLPREMEGFTVDLFADAVVAYPGRSYPYEPVERVVDLVEESGSMCGLGTTVFKSIANEAVCRAVLDGMEFEYVYPPSVLEATVAWNPERVMEAASRENCTVLVHDALPDEERCGLGIFDDRAGICCHDADTRALRAWVDTDAPEARDWALSVFERYRDEARPVDADYLDGLLSSDLTA